MFWREDLMILASQTRGRCPWMLWACSLSASILEQKWQGAEVTMTGTSPRAPLGHEDDSHRVGSGSNSCICYQIFDERYFTRSLANRKLYIHDPGSSNQRSGPKSTPMLSAESKEITLWGLVVAQRVLVCGRLFL